MTIPYYDKVKTFFVEKNESHVKNLFVTINSLLQARTVNLNIVKNYVGGVLGETKIARKGQIKPQSYYTFLMRVFDNEAVDEMSFCLLWVSCFFLKKRAKAKYLTLDGTSWDFGDKYIHLLTLCIVYEGVSIPIWWKDLGHKGVSSQKERMDMMLEALERYDLSGLILLADREYFGEIWFDFLQSKGIEFIIRSKKENYRALVDTYLSPFEDESKRYNSFQKKRYSHLMRLADSPMHEHTGVAKFIKIMDKTYLFVMYKNPNPKADEADKMLFFISSLKKREQVIKAYPIRWSIEVCFKHLKSNGFNLEDMNVKGEIKQDLMISILVFLYTLSIVEGLGLHEKENKKLKHYKNGKKYLAVSIFKKGNDFLICNVQNLVQLFLTIAKIITDKPPNWVICRM
jgi:Transposase DDE domain